MTRNSAILTALLVAAAIAMGITAGSSGSTGLFAASLLCAAPLALFMAGFTVRGITLDYRLVKRQPVEASPRLRAAQQAAARSRRPEPPTPLA